MKRVGYVYDRLIDREFIKQTIQKASKHKTKRRMVKKVLANLDEYTDKIREMIVTDNIVLRHKLFYRLEETVRKAKEHVCFSVAKRLIAFFSWLKNMAIGYIYYRNHIKPIVRIGKLKRIMSKGEVCYG